MTLIGSTLKADAIVTSPNTLFGNVNNSNKAKCKQKYFENKTCAKLVPGSSKFKKERTSSGKLIRIITNVFQKAESAKTGNNQLVFNVFHKVGRVPDENLYFILRCKSINTLKL
jgi:hypothetical protein